MKKSLIVGLTLLALLTVISPTQAKDSTDSSTLREQRRESVKEAQEEFKEKRTEAREEFKASMSGTRQEFRDGIAQRHADRLENRFTIYYSRLSQIISKLQSRINALKEDGKDVTSIQTKLDEAKTSLEKAKTLADQATAGFSAIDPEKYNEQKSEAIKARDLAQQARQQFKLTLASLKEVIRLLKNLK